MTQCLIVLSNCMKFQPNSFNSIQLIEQTRNYIFWCSKGNKLENIQELWFLCMTCPVLMCFTSVRSFVEISLTVIKLLSGHHFATDSRTDRRTDPRGKNNMSRDMRKPDFCICENKDANQLRGNREADQRLCFRYTDSTIPLLPKYKISSL